MPTLAPEKIKSFKLSYDSLFAELEQLLREYKVPGQDYRHDRKVYQLLRQLSTFKIPKLNRVSASSSQYVASFEKTFCSDVWLKLATVVMELVHEHSLITKTSSIEISDLDDAYRSMCFKINTISAHCKPFLRALMKEADILSVKSLEEFGTLHYIAKISSITETLVETVIRKLFEQALRSTPRNQFLLVRNILKYDVSTGSTSACCLFEKLLYVRIEEFELSQHFFHEVSLLQDMVCYSCEDRSILCQSLLIRIIDSLVMNFENYERVFDDCRNKPRLILSVLENLQKITEFYYPRKLREFHKLVLATISALINEEHLTSFVILYEEIIASNDGHRIKTIREYVQSTLAENLKLIEKICKWICKVSEDHPFSVTPVLLRSCSVFLNDLFLAQPKYDEILWGLYKKKYFLRSILKSLNNSEDVIKSNSRFDQKLFEFALLKSEHLQDLRYLNRECIDSLKMKPLEKMTALVLKRDTISDAIDSSDIAGLILPQPLAALVARQWEYYKSFGKNGHKTVSLQYRINLLELKSPFTHGPTNIPVILHVNLLQAAIFYLFTGNEHLSLEDIKKTLTKDKHEIPQIDRNMEMFLNMNMFKRDDQNRLYLNKKYKPKKEALTNGKLTLYHLPKLPPSVIAIDKADNQWFTQLVTAKIVRILKDRRRCTKTELYDLVSVDFHGISRGEFKDALDSCKDYYKLDNGNVQYII